MLERLQKIIARAGVASRRASEELILAGRVRVNSKVVNELGAKADPFNDTIEVDGKRLVAEDLFYIVLHKPRGVVATVKDPEGRPTVAELVSGLPARLYPVGRLDFATSGVLLMTNDGELANGLLHPRGGVPKTYVMKVQGLMNESDLETWRQGVTLDDGPTLPAGAKLIRREEDKTWIEVTIREGRNQQIRRMGEATGFKVLRLARTSFAGITNEGIRPGEWRPLTRDELISLREQFGVPKRIKPAITSGREATARAPRPGEGPAPRVRAARTGRSETKPREAAPRGSRAPSRGRR